LSKRAIFIEKTAIITAHPLTIKCTFPLCFQASQDTHPVATLMHIKGLYLPFDALAREFALEPYLLFVRYINKLVPRVCNYSQDKFTI
jgi:hypothetical protein